MKARRLVAAADCSWLDQTRRDGFGLRAAHLCFVLPVEQSALGHLGLLHLFPPSHQPPRGTVWCSSFITSAMLHKLDRDPQMHRGIHVGCRRVARCCAEKHSAVLFYLASNICWKPHKFIFFFSPVSRRMNNLFGSRTCQSHQSLSSEGQDSFSHTDIHG